MMDSDSGNSIPDLPDAQIVEIHLKLYPATYVKILDWIIDDGIDYEQRQFSKDIPQLGIQKGDYLISLDKVCFNAEQARKTLEKKSPKTKNPEIAVYKRNFMAA